MSFPGGMFQGSGAEFSQASGFFWRCFWEELDTEVNYFICVAPWFGLMVTWE